MWLTLGEVNHVTARKEDATDCRDKPLTSTAHLSTLIFLFITLLSADITSLFRH